MRSTIRSGTAAVAMGAALLCTGGTAARANPIDAAYRPTLIDGAVDQAGQMATQSIRWCVRGATLTVAVSTVLAAPAMVTGVGAPFGAAELAAAAGTGCGFGVLWGAAVSGVSWVADKVMWWYDTPGPRIINTSYRL